MINLYIKNYFFFKYKYKKCKTKFNDYIESYKFLVSKILTLS